MSEGNSAMTSIFKNILGISEDYAHSRNRRGKGDHLVAKEMNQKSDFAAKETRRWQLNMQKIKQKQKKEEKSCTRSPRYMRTRVMSSWRYLGHYWIENHRKIPDI